MAIYSLINMGALSLLNINMLKNMICNRYIQIYVYIYKYIKKGVTM